MFLQPYGARGALDLLLCIIINLSINLPKHLFTHNTVKMPPGRPEDTSVTRHFLYTKISEGKTIAKCLKCTDYSAAKNTTREREHLQNDCTGYRASIAAEGPSKVQQRLDEVVHRKVTKKMLADQRFALAVYATNRPFTIFDSPEFKLAFSTFDYVPPARKRLAGDLLDRAFLDVQEKVHTMMKKWRSRGIGLVCDESSNIANKRIHNVCAVLNDPKQTTLLWDTSEITEDVYDASVIARYLAKHGNSMTDKQPQMIKSLSSDTCELMSSACEKLRQMFGFESLE